MAIMFGRILRLRTDRGFGFLRDRDGVERFFHGRWVYGSIPFDQLQPGHDVTFEPEATERGPIATYVEACPTE